MTISVFLIIYHFSVQVIGGLPSLDAMLGDLQEDMTKQGVKTQQKGVCAACEKPIVGQVTSILASDWSIQIT